MFTLENPKGGKGDQVNVFLLVGHKAAHSQSTFEHWWWINVEWKSVMQARTGLMIVYYSSKGSLV